MHEAKGLAAFPPVQTFSEVCGAQCVPELSRLVLPWQRGKEQRCLGGRAGQQHAEVAPRRSWQLPISSALSEAYTTQWRVLTHWGMLALGCKLCILVGVSDTSAYQGTWLATGKFRCDGILLDKGQHR